MLPQLQSWEKGMTISSSTRDLKHSHSTVAFLFLAMLTFHLSRIRVKEWDHSHVWGKPRDSMFIWVQAGITDLPLEKGILSPLAGSLSAARGHIAHWTGALGSGSVWAPYGTEHQKIFTVWEQQALFILGRGVSRKAQEWETSMKQTISPLWLLFFFFFFLMFFSKF